MKKTKLVVIAALFALAACKNKDQKASTSADELKTGTESTTPAGTEGSVQTAINQLPAATVKEIETSLQKPEMGPKDMLKELNGIAKTKGFAAFKVALCAQDKVYMDSLIVTAAKIEKALEINMMDMINSTMSQTEWDPTKVEYGAEKITGNTATLELIDKNTSKKTTMDFVKENGAWKIYNNFKDKTKGQMDPMAAMNFAVKAVENATPEQKKKFKEMMIKNMESAKSLNKKVGDTAIPKRN